MLTGHYWTIKYFFLSWGYLRPTSFSWYRSSHKPFFSLKWWTVSADGLSFYLYFYSLVVAMDFQGFSLASRYMPLTISQYSSYYALILKLLLYQKSNMWIHGIFLVRLRLSTLTSLWLQENSKAFIYLFVGATSSREYCWNLEIFHISWTQIFYLFIVGTTSCHDIVEMWRFSILSWLLSTFFRKTCSTEFLLWWKAIWLSQFLI